MNNTKTPKQRTKPATASTTGNTNSVRSNGSAEPAQPEPSHSEIASLAQQIYEREGCPEGCADEHWYQAERELRTRRANFNSDYEAAQRDRLAVA